MWHTAGAGPPSLQESSLCVSWYGGIFPAAAQYVLLQRNLPLQGTLAHG